MSNWYINIKLADQSLDFAKLVDDGDIDIHNFDSYGLPLGFNLLQHDNGWYVVGPKDFVLVDREIKKDHALRLAWMRLRILFDILKKDLPYLGQASNKNKPFARSLDY